MRHFFPQKVTFYSLTQTPHKVRQLLPYCVRVHGNVSVRPEVTVPGNLWESGHESTGQEYMQEELCHYWINAYHK